MATTTITDSQTTGRGDTKTKAAAAQGGQLRVLQYVSDSIGTSSSSNINLAPADGWNWNAVKIHQIFVLASASTDFDILLYPNDQYVANTHYYFNEANNIVMNDKPIGGLFYVDLDGSQELHLQIANDDSSNASLFSIFVVFSPISNI